MEEYQKRRRKTYGVMRYLAFTIQIRLIKLRKCPQISSSGCDSFWLFGLFYTSKMKLISCSISYHFTAFSRHAGNLESDSLVIKLKNAW